MTLTEEFLGQRREIREKMINQEEKQIREDDAVQEEEDEQNTKRGKDIMTGTVDAVAGLADGFTGGSGVFVSAGNGINKLNNSFFDWTKQRIINSRTKRKANYEQAASNALYDKLIAANWSDREIQQLYEVGGETLSTESIGQIVARLKYGGIPDDKVEEVRNILQSVKDE